MTSRCGTSSVNYERKTPNSNSFRFSMTRTASARDRFVASFEIGRIAEQTAGFYKRALAGVQRPASGSSKR